MIVSCVKSYFVSAALLAAIAVSCGTVNASDAAQNAALARAAYSELRKGDASSAIEKFSRAIESRTMSPEMLTNALLNRALAYQQLGKHQAAVDDYTSAIALDVMSPGLRATALHNRGLSHQKLQNLAAAIEDFTTSLLLEPHSPHAFYNRGLALRDSRQYLFALSDFERALRYKHPDTARVLFASANTYIALNRPEDAKKALNAALLANPDFGQARAQLVLLGDESARLQPSRTDVMATGSVSALAGGTLATKPTLPKAVEPPTVLAAAAPIKRKKLFVDRLPPEQADTDPETLTLAALDPEQVVEVEQVPEIPPPVRPDKAGKATKKKPSNDAGEDVVRAADEGQAPSAAPAATPSKWSVQVASTTSEEAAWSTWKKMQDRYKVLKSLKPVVVRADLGTKGVFYRVRIGGFSDQGAASKACSTYKASGVNCFISRVDG